MTTTHSQSLYERSLLSIPGAVNSPVRAFGSVGGTPLFIDHARGAYIRDVDSNTYVDLVGSWGPALLGHAFPEVVQAVREAAQHGLSFGAPTENEVKLAEAITARVPAAQKVRMVSTGTEATMTAIRLARGFTGRRYVVKFAGCYHGHSDGLLVAAGSGVATQGLPQSAGVTEAIAADTLVLPYNDSDALARVFDEKGTDIAAVITEAAPANMGIVPPQDDFNLTIRRLTNEYGALMIMDEVLTGFRVGPSGFWGLDAFFEPHQLPAVLPDFNVDTQANTVAHTIEVTDASITTQQRKHYLDSLIERVRYTPDLFTFGKVIGGGMPLAALGGRIEVMDMLAPLGSVYQAGTLSGNPLATAAGLATLQAADLAVYTRIDTVSDVLRGYLHKALTERQIPHRINRAGNLFSVFFGSAPAEHGVHNYAEAQKQDAQMYRCFFHEMLRQGVALPPSCYEAWFISSAHDDRAVERICAAIDSAADVLADEEFGKKTE
ncbi:MAG: glutamate-1-semialdehyde 2,1-aminomutase [Actinomycetaceae bacterium]|nr:glutamate-1-semialdehyde 2,1-aminomutase [Actinomycetaceae bacterium]